MSKYSPSFVSILLFLIIIFAIAEGSKVFLESQGLWQYIKAFVEPIHNIKVIDKTTKSKLFFNFL